jgi:hypothetical protein
MPKAKVMHCPSRCADIVRIARAHQHHNDPIELSPIHHL